MLTTGVDRIHQRQKVTVLFFIDRTRYLSWRESSEHLRIRRYLELGVGLGCRAGLRMSRLQPCLAHDHVELALVVKIGVQKIDEPESLNASEISRAML